MSKIAEVVRHPGVYAERLRWKSRRFLSAVRRVALHTPEWQRAMNRRQEVVDYGPLHIFLETASPCNLRCPMCPTGAGQITRPHGMLKVEMAEKLAREIKHRPNQVGLWLGGEPLLNRDLMEIIRILAAKDLPVAMHTNATKLTPEKSRELIEAGLRWISFSFDGLTEEQYHRMRVGGNYQQTLENIRTFLRIKREMKSPTPHVVIQLVKEPDADEDGLGEAPQTPPKFQALFDDLPVDEFHTRLAHSWSGQLDSDMVVPNHAGIGQRTSCRIPYTDLTISWNGDAVSCCGDLNAANVLGNFNEENLYDLWNNEHFRRFRREMHSHEVESRPLCGTCERIWVNPHRNDYQLRLEMLRYRLRV